MPITATQKATTYARLNLMRVGASRLDYYQPTFKAVIATVDRSAHAIRVAGLSINDVLDGTPNTATMRVSGFTPLKGQEVRLALGSLDLAHTLFAGHILAVKQIYEAEKPANVAYDLSCISYEWLLNRRLVTKRYTNSSTAEIVRDVIANFAAGFTTTHVATDLPVIDEITFTNTEMSNALDRLAKRIGGYWYVDYAKDLHFFLTETGQTAGPIVNGAPRSAADIAATTDLSQVKTRVSFEGGGSATLAPCAVGDAMIPVTDSVWYSASGGVVVSGPQRITYTGLADGWGGALVGTTAMPTNGPAVAAKADSGLSAGVYSYKATFTSGAGETKPGPASANITMGDFVAHPLGTLTDGGDIAGSLSTGHYEWSYTWTFPTGETLGADILQLDIVSGRGRTVVRTESAPTDATSWNIYRTAADGSTLALVVGGRALGSSSYNDTLADASLGVSIGSATRATYGAVRLTSIPIGPAGTTGRKVYRTVANGGTWKLQSTIANNTTTTGTDTTADGSLGADAPSTDTSGLIDERDQVEAGSTSLLVTSTAPFQTTGGWASIGALPIRYTGVSSTSLTGLPATGDGSLGTTVKYGVEVIAAAMLTGIPAGGAGSILYAIAAGEDVNLLVTVDDTTAQATMASLVGSGDGIHEDYLQDRRISSTEATARATAQLQLEKDPLVTMTYTTHDQTTKSGRTVTFSLAAPTSLSGTFKIQTVTMSDFDPLGRRFPRCRVHASSRRFTFESLLNLTRTGA